MRKIAIIASALALAATQMSTAVLAADTGDASSSSGHKKPFSDPTTIAVSLGALTAVVLGVVAATDDDKKPASP